MKQITAERTRATGRSPSSHVAVFAAALAAGTLVFGGAARAQGQHAVLFRGLPASFGTLEQRSLSVPNSVVAPLGQQPVKLLPLEANGRTELSRCDPDSPWRYEDVPGAARIRLPGARGSLYHYEQDYGGGTRAFGWFVIGPDGAVRRLLERKGTGPAGDQDPFLATIGVSADGQSILLATTVAGGGDLLEFAVDGSSIVDRTSADAPLAWIAESLTLGPAFGIAAHAGGVRTFARRLDAPSVEVTFPPPTPTYFSGAVAAAEGGRFACFVAGTSPTSADVYVISAQGLLARATPQPAAISSAGWLPGSLDGPYLSVSDDGASCAWRTEGTTREAFLARVPWQTAVHSSQLTADTLFTDTIDEVGQFAFRPTGEFVFTAGETVPIVGGVDKIDVFRAVLPIGAAGPTLENLSLSSGVLAPPYLVPGTIRPQGAVDLSAGHGRLLLDQNQDAVVVISPQGGSMTTLLSQVKSFDAIERDGSRWLIALRRTFGSQPREIRAWNGDPASPTVMLVSSAMADGFDGLAVRGDRGAVLERTNATLALRVFDLASGTTFPFPIAGISAGGGLSVSATGIVCASLGTPPQAAAFVRWQPPGPVRRLGEVNGPGFVLRGL